MSKSNICLITRGSSKHSSFSILRSPENQKPTSYIKGGLVCVSTLSTIYERGKPTQNLGISSDCRITCRDRKFKKDKEKAERNPFTKPSNCFAFAEDSVFDDSCQSNKPTITSDISFHRVFPISWPAALAQCVEAKRSTAVITSVFLCMLFRLSSVEKIASSPLGPRGES